MAIIKKKEINQMSEPTLNSKVTELRKELIRYNSQLSTGTPPENPGRIRAIKRTIARLHTSLKLLQDKPAVVEEVKKKQ